MKKTHFMKGILMGLVLSLVFAMATVSGVQAATIYVDHNNDTGVEDGTVDNPYNTIQEGIDAANFGDTVQVQPGTYTGDLTIDGKNIYLIGGDPAITTIQGTSNVITISGVFSTGSEEVEIAGFTITGGASRGVLLNSNSSKAIIHNNIITNNANGVYAAGEAKSNIFNNIITYNSGSGIYTQSSCCNDPTMSISNNIITNNGSYGIDRNRGTVSSFYNNIWAHTSSDYSGTISTIGDISSDPFYVDASNSDYHLAANSPCIDSGRPIAADNDPDGTRNDQGAYGGPFAASFWPSPAGGPVVTDLQVTPPSVPSEGTITIRATGEIR